MVDLLVGKALLNLENRRKQRDRQEEGQERASKKTGKRKIGPGIAYPSSSVSCFLRRHVLI